MNNLCISALPKESEFIAFKKKAGCLVLCFFLFCWVPLQTAGQTSTSTQRLWGTYYGGGSAEYGWASAVDSNGNVFIAGQTISATGIATAGAYQSTYFPGNWSGYLAKFNSNGVRQWGTYFQGSVSGDDRAEACAVDFSGNIYIAGVTTSDTGIATPGAHQTIHGGDIWDVFLAKFNTNGERIWATYYGGQGNDQVWGGGGALATDKNGNVFMAGQTYSDTGIATPGAYQTTITGGAGFLTKFDSNGIRKWGTYYSGDMATMFCSCATDTSGNVYATGMTNSSFKIASPGAYQTTYGGQNDAFLVAFDPLGQRLWGTYYGGPLEDWGKSCTTDKDDHVYLVGSTRSLSGIASPGCHQDTFGGGLQDGFMAKFNNLGQRIWGTYYGGLLYDEVMGCSAGWNGDIFFSGVTQSSDNISTPNSFQPSIAGSYDAFLTKFNVAGQRQWGTYFGGSAYDWSGSCNYVPDDTIYIQGDAQSLNNIATLNGHQIAFGGGMQDAFLEKFIDCWPIAAAQPIIGPDSVCQSTDNVVYTTSPLEHAVDYKWTLPQGTTLVSGAGTPSIMVNFGDTAITGFLVVKGLNKCGDPGDSSSLLITVSPHPVPVITGPDTVCRLDSKTYTTESGMTGYLWSVSPAGNILLGGGLTDNFATISWNATGSNWVSVNYTNPAGCTGISATQFNTWVIPEGPQLTTTPLFDSICSGDTTYILLTSNQPGTLFSWTATGSGPQVTGYSNGSGNLIDQKLINSGLNPETVTYTIIPFGSGCPGIPADYIVTVLPVFPVNVSINATTNPVCGGIPVTFTATPINGGSSPIYQWHVNATNAGMNNAVFTYTPINGDTVTCILTSSEPCTSS
ncbi:MAG: PKD-like domain-containing protein, partial [Bacteroidota bacterium]